MEQEARCGRNKRLSGQSESGRTLTAAVDFYLLQDVSPPFKATFNLAPWLIVDANSLRFSSMHQKCRRLSDPKDHSVSWT
jgi:hypothetical protein